MVGILTGADAWLAEFIHAIETQGPRAGGAVQKQRKMAEGELRSVRERMGDLGLTLPDLPDELAGIEGWQLTFEPRT